MSNSINHSKFIQYVEIYNTQSREAARDYVTRDCNIDFPTFQRKMRSETRYFYNRSNKKLEQRSEEAQFISLDDLCTRKLPAVKQESPHAIVSTKDSFDEIIIDLMRDRLTELSKYIRFDQSAKQVIVNSKSLNESGYRLHIV